MLNLIDRKTKVLLIVYIITVIYNWVIKQTKQVIFYFQRSGHSWRKWMLSSTGQPHMHLWSWTVYTLDKFYLCCIVYPDCSCFALFALMGIYIYLRKSEVHAFYNYVSIFFQNYYSYSFNLYLISIAYSTSSAR
jgi:hypothetical protein